MRQVHGVLPAIVTETVDPDNRGRMKVRIPRMGASGREDFETWAPLATPASGRCRRAWSPPAVNDEVLIAFEDGDPRHPYVIGWLWSGAGSPPEAMDDERSGRRLSSRGGVHITIDDQGGQERFLVETRGGRLVMLTSDAASVEITDGSGNSVRFGKSGIAVKAAAKVTIDAGQVEINAGVISVNAGMSKFSGTVTCDTLISTSVVSTSYSPGAGNVL